MHWISKQKLIQPKRERGIEFGDLFLFRKCFFYLALCSIFESNDILRIGTRWRVGRGENIKILKDPRLPC
jgi:hypothetical protein